MCTILSTAINEFDRIHPVLLYLVKNLNNKHKRSAPICPIYRKFDYFVRIILCIYYLYMPCTEIWVLII